MNLEASGWSGEGTFTKLLIVALREIPAVEALRVEDAPASRADTGFSFISNELYVLFASTTHTLSRRKERLMTLGGLELALADIPEIGAPDYSDDGMLQYLRTERILQPYQTRSYKMIELVRLYETGTLPRRDS
jgi:hypothetical protein